VARGEILCKIIIVIIKGEGDIMQNNNWGWGQGDIKVGVGGDIMKNKLIFFTLNYCFA